MGVLDLLPRFARLARFALDLLLDLLASIWEPGTPFRWVSPICPPICPQFVPNLGIQWVSSIGILYWYYWYYWGIYGCPLLGWGGESGESGIMLLDGPVDRPLAV